jgi:hypothetical protein
MKLEEIVTELLLRWENNRALTPDQLCQEYEGQPDYAALLEAVKNELRKLQAVDRFLDNSNVEGNGSPTPRPAQPATPQAELGSTVAPAAVRLRCPHCHNPLQLADSSSEEVLCPACGSSFRVQDTTTTTTTGAMQ